MRAIYVSTDTDYSWELDSDMESGEEIFDWGTDEIDAGTLNEYPNSVDAGTLGVLGAITGAVGFVMLALSVFLLICQIKIFRKAGYAGWEAIVPVYNIICMFNMVGMNPVLILLMLVPCLNVVTMLYLMIKLTNRFGMGIGMFLLVLLVPFVGYPIWAFSNKYQYEGPC